MTNIMINTEAGSLAEKSLILLPVLVQTLKILAR